MPDQDPLLERLGVARPTLPTGLRARALAAGHAAWTPWWRRLSTWAAAAAAVLALDAGVLATSAPPPTRPRAAPPAEFALVDDPDMAEWVRHRQVYAQQFHRQRSGPGDPAARRQAITDILESQL